MTEVLIGVDLGGTRIRVGRYDRHLNLLERKETLTLAHEGLEPTIKRIKNMIREILPEDGTQVEGIGFSAPSALNPKTGVVMRPPNLHGWHNVPLGDIIHDEFGIPVYLGNDANVAALAEVAKGAAQGYRHAIYVTVSTGIGSGMVIDGQLLLGDTGLGAEVGHIPILVDGDRVSTLELEAAGPALARKARARIEAGETSSILELAGGDVAKIDARIVGDAAQAGDALALSIVERAGWVVGLGVVTMLHLFNPQIVVIGGGVSKLGDLLFNPIWRAVKEHVIDESYYQDLKIVQPELADDVALIGAAALVLTHGGQDDVNELMTILGK